MTKRGNVPYLVMFLLLLFLLNSYSATASGACCANWLLSGTGLEPCVPTAAINQYVCCDQFEPDGWDTAGENPLVPDNLAECISDFYDAGPLVDCAQSSNSNLAAICSQAVPTTTTTTATTGTVPTTTISSTTIHLTTTTVGQTITTITQTTTTSKGSSTTTTPVAYQEVCNNGVDDDANGYIDCSDGYCLATKAACDPAMHADKCTWAPNNNANAYRCCAFSQDCDNNGYAETCGVCACETKQEKPNNVKISHVPGQYKFLLNWELSCTGPVSFDVYRCEGSGCNPVDKRNPQPVSGLSFKDTIEKPLTTYCYEVRANYGMVQKRSDIVCTKSGDKECLENTYGEFCGPAEKPTMRLKCDSYNRKQLIEDCTKSHDASWGCYGPYSDSGAYKTKCVKHNSCDLCNNVFKFFGNPVLSLISVGGQDKYCSNMEFCYYDNTQTIANQFIDCGTVTGGNGCYAYNSKYACEESALPGMISNNRCLPRNCTWNWISEPLGVGVCSEQDPALQKCGLCTERAAAGKPNAVFGLCTVETCKKYGDCYPRDLDNDGTIGNYNPNPPAGTEACLNMREVSCEDFPQNDCEGNTNSKYISEGAPPQQIEVDVAYNDPVLRETRVSGTNKITLHSLDYFDFGVCAFSLADNCFKDRDFDGNRDPNPTDMYSPRTIIENNRVMGTLQLPFQVADQNQAGVSCQPGTQGCTGSQALYTCLVNSTAVPCYPGNKIDTPLAGTGTISSYTSEGNGTYKLYYYSIDMADNLEDVNYVNITVDKEPPEINLTPPYFVRYSQQLPYNDSNATIFITVSEYSKCSDWFYYSGSKYRQGIVNANGTFFTANYSNLSDGYYAYRVVCDDAFGNRGTLSTNIRISADTRIQGLYPNGTVDSGDVQLTVKTKSRASACKYKDTSATSWSPLDVETEGNSHLYWNYSHVVTGLADGEHSYSIQCIINGVAATSTITFVVDTAKPTTLALDGNYDPYNFTVPKATHKVYLRCIDDPRDPASLAQIGFGCDKTYYCISAATCTPKTVYPGETNPLTINAGSVFCFMSTQKTRSYLGNVIGGGNESTRCYSLITDEILPYLYVDLLDAVPRPGYYLTGSNPLKITGRIVDYAFDSSATGSKWPSTLAAKSYTENSTLLANFNLTTNMSFAGDYAELWFRYTDANNYYYLRIDNQDKFPGMQRIKVAKKAGGSDQVIDERISQTILENKPIDVEIIAQGTAFKIKVNGSNFNQTLTFSDSAFSSGRVGARAPVASSIAFGKVLIDDYDMQVNNRIFMQALHSQTPYTQVGLANWQTFALNVTLPGNFSSCKHCTQIDARAYDRANNIRQRNYWIYLDQNGPFFDNASLKFYNAQAAEIHSIEFGSNASVELRIYDTNNNLAKVNVTDASVSLGSQLFIMANKTGNRQSTQWQAWLSTEDMEPGTYNLTFAARDALNNTNSTVFAGALKVKDTKPPVFNVTVYKDEAKTLPVSVVGMGPYWVTVRADELSNISIFNLTNSFGAPPIAINLENRNEFRQSWNGWFTINQIAYLNQNERLLGLNFRAKDRHNNSQILISETTGHKQYLILNSTGPRPPVFDPAISSSINGAYDDVYPGYLSAYADEPPENPQDEPFYTGKPRLFITGSAQGSAKTILKIENSLHTVPVSTQYAHQVSSKLMDTASLNTAGKGVRAAASGSTAITFYYNLASEPIGTGGNYLWFAGHDRNAYGQYKKYYMVTGSSWDGTMTTIGIQPGLEQNVAENELIMVYSGPASSDWFGLYTTQFAPGNNTMYATATDTVGNEGNRSAKHIIFFDNRSPEVVASMPLPNWALGNQTTNITLTVRDPKPSSRLRLSDTNITIRYTNVTGEYRLYSGQFTSMADISDLDTNSNYTQLEFDVKQLFNVGQDRHFWPLQNGMYNVSVVLRDRAHNYVAYSWKFSILLGVPNIPTVSLTDIMSNPVSNPYDLYQDNYLFTKETTGIGIRFTYAGESNINLSNVAILPNDAAAVCQKQPDLITFNCLFSAGLSQNTAYKVSFTANRVLSSGKLGPSSTNSIYLVTDQVAPQVAAMEYNDISRSGAILPVKLYNLNEQFDVNTSVYLDNVLLGTAITHNAAVEFSTLRVQNLSDGTYALMAILADQAGNLFNRTGQIRIDTTPPVLAIGNVNVTDTSKAIKKKGPITWITGDSNVSITGTYTEPNMDYICYINQNAGMFSCDNNTNTARILAGNMFGLYAKVYGLANGTNVNNTITLVGVDKPGNRANVSINVISDMTPPSISLTEPSSGYSSSQRPLIKIKTNEAAACNLSYNTSSSYISAAMEAIDSGFNQTYQITSDLAANAATLLKVECRDELGSARKESFVLNVDITKPLITDVSVTGGYRNSSTVISSIYTVYSLASEAKLVATASEPVICKYGKSLDYATMKKFPGYDSRNYATLPKSNSTSAELVVGQTVTFYVKCEDRSGNVADAYTVNIKSDPNAPVVPFNPKPVGYVNTKNPIASVNTYRVGDCNITGAGVTNAPMARTAVLAGMLFNFTYHFYNLQEDTTYTVTVNCLGSPGGSVTFSFVIDTTGPAAVIDVQSGTVTPAIYANYSEDVAVDSATLTKLQTGTVPLTEQNLSARKYIYTPRSELANGQYTFAITATDMRGNAKQTLKNFTIPTGEIAITLVKPLNGYVSTSQFEVEISTDQTANCRYKPLTDGTYPTMNYGFTTVDGRTHTIDDFNYTPLTRAVYPIYIRCADRWGTANTQSVRVDFRYDPNPPVITASVSPPTITEARLLDGLMQAYTTLTVTSGTKPTLCRYSLTQQDYNLMENNMSSIATTHSSNIIVANPEVVQTFTYYVQCISQAGVKSDVKEVTFTVDMDALPAISQISPPDNSYVSSGSSLEINVSANKPVNCTLTSTGSLLTYTGKSATVKLNHQFTLPTLTKEGMYPFEIRCEDEEGQEVAATTRLGFDKTAPSVPDMVYLYSCTGKQVNFRAKSADNLSSIIGYNVSIEDDTNSTNIITNEFISGDEDQIFKLTRDDNDNTLKLLSGHDYILTLRSMNSAGLSSTATTTDFNVDPEDSHCGSTIIPTPGGNHCENGIQDSNETSKDCGGVCVSEGLKCDYGELCQADTDCVGGYCNPSTKKCDKTLCQNNQTDPLNGETDVDCGGAKCTGCNLGKACKLDRDCGTGTDIYCDQSTYTCKKKSCSDKVQNSHDSGTETDVDCGGPCVRESKLCATGTGCDDNSDCESNFCNPLTKLCAEATCSDGYQDQDETGTDCGGACAAMGKTCPDGIRCMKNEDCSGNYCSDAGTCGQSPGKDTDNDGMPDLWETQHNLDPSNPGDAATDNDKDGLTNLEEYKSSTDPNKADTDGDGYSDKAEIDAGTDPNDPSSLPQKSNVFRTILLILIFIIIIAGAIYLAYTELRKMGGLSGRKKPLAPPRDFSQQRTLEAMKGPLPRVQQPPSREELMPKLPPGEIAAKKMIKEREKSQQLKKLFGVFGSEESGETPAAVAPEAVKGWAPKEEAAPGTSDRWVELKAPGVKRAAPAPEDDIFKKLSSIAKSGSAKGRKERDVFKELSKIAVKKRK